MDPDHLISQIDIKQTDDSNCFVFITDTFDDLCKPNAKKSERADLKTHFNPMLSDGQVRG